MPPKNSRCIPPAEGRRYIIRLKYKGEYFTLRKLAERIGMPLYTLERMWNLHGRPRIIREKHLSYPPREKGVTRKELLEQARSRADKHSRVGRNNGIQVTIKGVGTYPSIIIAAREFGISFTAMRRRVRLYGPELTIEQAKVYPRKKKVAAVKKQTVSKKKNRPTDEWLMLSNKPRRK